MALLEQFLRRILPERLEDRVDERIGRVLVHQPERCRADRRRGDVDPVVEAARNLVTDEEAVPARELLSERLWNVEEPYRHRGGEVEDRRQRRAADHEKGVDLSVADRR